MLKKELVEYLAFVIIIPVIIVIEILYVIDNYHVITDPYVYNYTKIVNEGRLKGICDIRKSPETAYELGYNGDFEYTYNDLKASYLLHLDNRKTPRLLNILANSFGRNDPGDLAGDLFFYQRRQCVVVHCPITEWGDQSRVYTFEFHKNHQAPLSEILLKLTAVFNSKTYNWYKISPFQ